MGCSCIVSELLSELVHRWNFFQSHVHSQTFQLAHNFLLNLQQTHQTLDPTSTHISNLSLGIRSDPVNCKEYSIFYSFRVWKLQRLNLILVFFPQKLMSLWFYVGHVKDVFFITTDNKVFSDSAFPCPLWFLQTSNQLGMTLMNDMGMVSLDWVMTVR